LTNDEYEFEGEHWSMPKRRVLPKPLQKPHPPLWGATGSRETHKIVGEMGMGLCSFAVGTPPSEIEERIKIYREGIANCTEPVGKFINNQAATFSMVCCAPSTEEAVEVATESFEWYPRHGAEILGSIPAWLAEMEQDLGTYDYLKETKKVVDEGAHKLISMDYLRDANACVVGDPDEVIRMCKAYEQAGVDLLLCLVNPYKIPHEKVKQTIELMGKYVLPAFKRGDR